MSTGKGGSKGHHRRKPNRGLACFDCGGVSIDVSSTTFRLSRFVRDGMEAGHSEQLIHAPCRCTNKKCGNEWNSRHPIAIGASREADHRKTATVRVIADQIKPKGWDPELDGGETTEPQKAAG